MKRAIPSWLFFSGLLIFPAVLNAAPPALREIKVVAAVSPSFKQNPDWQKDIVERVGFANSIFERTFQLHFTVEKYQTWDLQDETREMHLLVEELKALSPPQPQRIVIGFHKMTKPFEKDRLEDIETVGTAMFFSGVIALRDPAGEFGAERGKFVLTHELAHLFGAVHISDSSAIMYFSLPEFPQEQIDPENTRIIQSTRAVDFKQGIDSLSGSALDGLIASYEKLIRQNPHSDFYRQLGLFYRKRGMEARAVSIWEEDVKYHYDDPLIHYELGIHYYKQGYYDRAVQELGSAIAHFVLPSQQKQKAATLNFLGVAYFEKDHLDQAIYAWMQGLVASPDNFELQSNLAAAYLKRGDIDRGESELLKLRAKHPDDPTVLSNLGSVAMERKKYEEAARYFSDALVKNVGSSNEKGGLLLTPLPEWELRMALGSAYLEMKNLSGAMTQLQRARLLKPDAADLRLPLARVYIEQKDYASALKELQAAVTAKKDNAYLYAMQGQVYAAMNRPQDAIAAAREGMRYASPELQAVLHRNIGATYAQDGNYPKAIEELKAALNLNWNDADAHYNLGASYARQGNLEEARRSFQNARRIRPNDALIRQALESLEKAGAR